MTSALKRARATLQQRIPRASEGGRPPAPRSVAESELVERFTRAFEADDLDGVLELLTADVWFAMPPMPYEWHGRERAGQFLAATWSGGRTGHRLIGTRANGQPAFGLYYPDPHGMVLHALGLLVLTLSGDRISAITRFDGGVLEFFGLPRTLPADQSAAH